MMEQKTGTFKEIDAALFNKDMQITPDKLKDLGPTIYVGEIVEIKGVKFQVRYFKPNGKIGLRMIVG